MKFINIFTGYNNNCYYICMVAVGVNEEYSMKRIKLSDSEWFIMKVLWEKSGVELKDITANLENETGWASGRIRTMLLRLIDKEAVYADKSTGVYKYFPAITKESCLKEEGKSFLKRIYSGSISEFISSFAKTGEISAKEQQEIMDILANMNNGEN